MLVTCVSEGRGGGGREEKGGEGRAAEKEERVGGRLACRTGRAVNAGSSANGMLLPSPCIRGVLVPRTPLHIAPTADHLGRVSRLTVYNADTDSVDGERPMGALARAAVELQLPGVGRLDAFQPRYPVDPEHRHLIPGAKSIRHRLIQNPLRISQHSYGDSALPCATIPAV